MTHVSTYVGLADHGEEVLSCSLRAVAEAHAHVADVFHTSQALASMADEHRRLLAPVIERYGEQESAQEPERLRHDALGGPREGEIGLVRDLQDLMLLATMTRTTWTVLEQAAQALRDRELMSITTSALADVGRQLAWLETRLKQAAPQALLVAE